MSASKLDSLLEAVWRSPVFGDSYSSAPTDFAAFQRKMRAVHGRALDTFHSILRHALPDFDASKVDELVRRIGSAATALGTSFALEIDDVEGLAAAGLYFALLYFGDTLMDEGDLAMVVAAERFIEA